MGYPLATDWEPWMQKIPYGPHLTRHIVYHKICWGMVGRVINPELYLGPPELDANGGLIRPTKAELLSQAATELPQKQVAGTRHDLAHAVAI